MRVRKTGRRFIGVGALDWSRDEGWVAIVLFWWAIVGLWSEVVRGQSGLLQCYDASSEG